MRWVVEAVLSLPEPYRGAILLRDDDDLPPREIARRLGLPVETVRTHVKRGLVRLRRELAAKAGDKGENWSGLLLPLVSVPAGAPSSVTAAALGVLAMGTKLWVAIGMLGLLLVGLLLFPTPATETVERARPPEEAGRFGLDVSSLVPATREGSLRQVDGVLRVEADDPDPLLAQRRVDVSPGPGEYEVEFHLVRAAAAVGRVMDGAGEPLVDSSVMTHARGGGIRLDVNHVCVLWHAGSVRPGGAVCRTDGEGRFRLAGLGRGLHRLEVRAAGTGTRMTLCTDVAGRASVLVDPAAHLALRVEHPGFATREFQVAPGPVDRPHEERVVLLRTVPHPRLVGRLVGDVKGVRVARVGCFTQQADGLETWVGDRKADVVDGTFEITDLEAGRTRLVVRLSACRVGVDMTGYVLPTEVFADLQDGVTCEVEVDVRRGGRLRIAARDADGAFLAAECHILDRAGQAVKALFGCRNARFSQAGPGRLGTLSASTVDPPLEKGRYTIELRAPGYRPWTGVREVELEETTDVDQRLHRIE